MFPELVAESRKDMQNVLLLAGIMLVTSVTFAVAECGFSKMT